MQHLKKKTDKNPFIKFRLFIFYKLSCLQQKSFLERLLSFRVFSADGHYRTSASMQTNTIASRNKNKIQQETEKI